MSSSMMHETCLLRDRRDLAPPLLAHVAAVGFWKVRTQ